MARKIDLINKQIGDLLVLEEFKVPYTGIQKNRKTVNKLKCKCKCGQIFYPFRVNVLSGKSTKCINCSGILYFTGLKIGHLLVIERDFSKLTAVFWKCKCDCGRNTVVPVRYLRTGTAPQKCEKCRHHKKSENKLKINSHEANQLTAYKKHLKKRNEVIGKKFNNLTVLKFSHWEYRNKRRYGYYLCRCKCKNLAKVRTDQILTTISCGCAQVKNVLKGEENPRSSLKNKEVKSIRELVKSGIYTQVEISEIFNVSPSTILSIIKKRTYNSVK